MARRMIWPDVTPARRAWLEQLQREPTRARRARGHVGFDCMRLGWTQWAWIAIDPSQPLAPTNMRSIGEVLTDKGRDVLQRSRMTK
jgi:hypothetical protein